MNDTLNNSIVDFKGEFMTKEKVMNSITPGTIDIWEPLPKDAEVPRSLGKLSLKEEAAGKIRVFAMVDAFTQ